MKFSGRNGPKYALPHCSITLWWSSTLGYKYTINNSFVYEIVQNERGNLRSVLTPLSSSMSARLRNATEVSRNISQTEVMSHPTVVQVGLAHLGPDLAHPRAPEV